MVQYIQRPGWVRHTALVSCHLCAWGAEFTGDTLDETHAGIAAVVVEHLSVQHMQGRTLSASEEATAAKHLRLLS